MSIMNIFTKIFGSSNERTLKRLRKIVVQINSLEPKYEKYSDEELKNMTLKFKEQLKEGKTLEQILPDAFAVVREASKRVYGMRHFDVQLMGGIVLNEDQIAEMKTGEGKTLTSTLPAYLNALTEKGVHIVTVNDYLASRDAAWSSKLFNFLGMTVSCNLPSLNVQEKQQAYACDITYGTNNEFGFDYLRDNMAFTKESRVQRGLYYALVDEVDSVLIDEARTPLIISGAANDATELYTKINEIIPQLKQQEREDSDTFKGTGHFSVDEKFRQVYLTERGQVYIEELLRKAGVLGENDRLFDYKNMIVLHHVNACLRAHTLFKKDIDYIVKNGEVMIVDEHTGRTLQGRRWSDGLHQAVEAKEHVKIQSENQTLASITFQNYFRLYTKLAGMTGTADTEAYEFQQIYGLNTVVLPTNMPMIRKDEHDIIYLSEEDKFQAIVKDIEEQVNKGRPVLVGTISIEDSEKLSNFLNEKKIPHSVLNAKFHQKEAEIVAQAGAPKTVTIATNMAGRGTDIVLGGNPQAKIDALENPTKEQIDQIMEEWKKLHEEVVVAGGLHIIGTSRHESRRIDNQLRGRAGRQGDPGSSRFYLSLDDNLLRIFINTERIRSWFKKAGMQPGDAIESKWVTRSIENAQRKVEERNFDVRKNLLEFDNVANEQRKNIYEFRNQLLEVGREPMKEEVETIMEDVMVDTVGRFIPPNSVVESWDLEGLEKALSSEFGIEAPVSQWVKDNNQITEDDICNRLTKLVVDSYNQKMAVLDEENILNFERSVMLQLLDRFWKEHLASMDCLRQGIYLRGYAQKNPKNEYKTESSKMFGVMLTRYKAQVVNVLLRVVIRTPEEVEQLEEERRREAEQEAKSSITNKQEEEKEQAKKEKNIPFTNSSPKVGRNDPCPCGSGKKYKNCCGKL